MTAPGAARSSPVLSIVAVWAIAGCAGLSLARCLRPPARRRVRFTEEENGEHLAACWMHHAVKSNAKKASGCSVA
jgi:hypothetical protein